MQAAKIAAFGDVDVLNFGEVPMPSPKSGHVLIKIEARDQLVRSGAVSGRFRFHMWSARKAAATSRSLAPRSALRLSQPMRPTVRPNPLY